LGGPLRASPKNGLRRRSRRSDRRVARFTPTGPWPGEATEYNHNTSPAPGKIVPAPRLRVVVTTATTTSDTGPDARPAGPDAGPYGDRIAGLVLPLVQLPRARGNASPMHRTRDLTARQTQHKRPPR